MLIPGILNNQKSPKMKAHRKNLNHEMPESENTPLIMKRTKMVMKMMVVMMIGFVINWENQLTIFIYLMIIDSSFCDYWYFA